MKRNMDLVRMILLAVESAPEGMYVKNAEIDVPGESDISVAEHVVIIKDAGMIEANLPERTFGQKGAMRFVIVRLTWSGHDYLESVRDPKVWSSTKETMISKGGAMTFDLIKAVATALLKQRLGLSPG